MYKPKTLDEIKADSLERVAKQIHPFIGTKIDDVQRGCQRLQNLDYDHWCQVWSEIAEPYEENGQRLEKVGQYAEAEKSYLLAYNYYRLARFPCPVTPAKQQAYRMSVANYQRAAMFFDPPLEKVQIPFTGKVGEGTVIPAYLRKPKDIARPPVIISHAGVDVFKEEPRVQLRAFLEKGIAILAVDMPGTGECPILGSTDAERLYSPIITYLQNRADLDGSRIGHIGLSFGGYWASKMAHLERNRLSAAVCWGGGAHYNFQPDWVRKSRYAPSHLGNIDLGLTRSNAFGIHDFEEWIEYCPRLSLLDQGILEQLCTQLLLVNGKNDLQVPVEDIYLLLEHGSAKSARVFLGGHMGHTPQTVPTIVDWMASKLLDKP
jgi:esterase FrsA